MVFNATFNIISVISWRLNNLDIKISIEIIDGLFKYSMMIQLYCGGQKTGLPGENHSHIASYWWYHVLNTWSINQSINQSMLSSLHKKVDFIYYGNNCHSILKKKTEKLHSEHQRLILIKFREKCDMNNKMHCFTSWVTHIFL